MKRSPLTKRREQCHLRANDCNHFCLLREQQNLYHRVSRSVLLGALGKVRLEKGPFVTMGSTLIGEKKWL